VTAASLAGMLAGPAAVPILADTSTVSSFNDLAAYYEFIVLVVVKEAPPEAPAWTLEIQRAYRGAGEGMITVRPSPDDPLDLSPGGRWLLLTTSLQTLAVGAHQVRIPVTPEGVVEAPQNMADVPATLAELDAFFGPAVTPAPEPAAAAEAPSAPFDVRDALPAIALAFVLGVLAIGLCAAAVAQRYLARDR
jgi:hypothetical protein